MWLYITHINKKLLLFFTLAYSAVFASDFHLLPSCIWINRTHYIRKRALIIRVRFIDSYLFILLSCTALHNIAAICGIRRVSDPFAHIISLRAEVIFYIPAFLVRQRPIVVQQRTHRA